MVRIGCIYNDFKPLPPTEIVLRDILKKYDANDDGRLSKAELTDAFRHLGSRIPGWRAGRGLHHADANRDGLVSKEELNDLVIYFKKHGYSV
jgi:Ca2+-binding EF-hand superfamily protein